MRRVPPTERVHADGIDLGELPARRLLARLHKGDREAVRAVGRALPALAALADEAAGALAAGGRIVYVGAGTSGRLGALDAAECPPTFGISRSRVLALIAGGKRALHGSVEGAEDDRTAAAAAVRRARVGPGDLVVGITASGTTPFVLAALAEARRRRSQTAILTSNPGARPQVDHRVLLDTGPERIAGSTRMKAGTATKMALGLVSTAAFVQLGAVYRGRMVALRPASEKLRRRAVRTVSEVGGVAVAAARAALRHSRWSVRDALAALGKELPPSGSPPPGSSRKGR
jgi:N-acetylmuramic acid 6-phosphate etherase